MSQMNKAFRIAARALRPVADALARASAAMTVRHIARLTAAQRARKA